MVQHATPQTLQNMNLKEYLISIGRLKPEPDQEPEPVKRESSYQTIGEIFDMMKQTDPEKLPANFFGANAGRWKTQIICPGATHR